MNKLIKLAALLMALVPFSSKAQFPQAPSQITFNANSAFVGGWSPSFTYNPSATSLLPPLQVSINGGTMTACGSLQQIPSQTLTLSASATNFIFINTAAGCAVQVNQSGFALSSNIPLYEITTSSSAVVTIVDVRTFISALSNSGSSFCPLTGCTFTGPVAGTTANFTTSITSPVVDTTTVNATAVNSTSIGAVNVNNILFPTTATEFISDIGSAPCTTGCTVVVTNALGFTVNTTVPSTVSLQITGSGNISLGSGDTFTINGPFVAPRKQVFDVVTGFSFGGQVNTVYPEWFGAKADWNGTTGTNNTTLIQAAINALTAGCVNLTDGTYMIDGTLSITKSGLGICGINNGYPALGSTGGVAAPSSVIINTSASADTIDVAGISQSDKIVWNSFTNFTLQRSVVPTAGSIVPGSSSLMTGAAGLSINHAGGVIITGMHSQDSIRGFYFHDAPNFTTGLVSTSEADWGFAAVPASSYTGGSSFTVCGFCVDSADGEAINSQTLVYDTVGTNTIPTITSYGLLVTGTAINDFETDWFSTSLVTDGINVDCVATTPSTPGGCQDLRFANSVLDGSFVSASVITGITSVGSPGSPVGPSPRGSVQLAGGWYSNFLADTPTVDIESSQGVNVSGLNITSTLGIGIEVNDSSDILVENNRIDNTPNIGIFISGTTSSNFVGNNLDITDGNEIATGIRVQLSSVNNNITDDILLIEAGATSTVAGISFDSTSNNNNVGSNAIVNWATPIADAGTNNALFPENGLVIGLSGNKYTDRQFSTTTTGCTAGAAIGDTCTASVTFPNAFPNASYKLSCYVGASTGAAAVSGNISPTSTSTTVTFTNLTTASNVLTVLNCEAWE